MISRRPFGKLDRRSVFFGAGCALLLAVLPLGTRPARTGANAAEPPATVLPAPPSPDGGGRIRTDRRVYAEPALPALPRAGGKFTDPVFGALVLRATDEAECPAPGCGTYYSHWPTFNADNTFILVRNGENGAALVKPFDPVNFSTGRGHQPGGIYVPGAGQTSVNFESAVWHPTDPHLIYCFSFSSDNGMRLYTYNVSTRKYALVKDLTPLGGPKDSLRQMSMSRDGDVFAWSRVRAGAGPDPVAYIVWRRSTDKVLYHTPTPNKEVNEVRLDKGGRYLVIARNAAAPIPPDSPKGGFLNLATGAIDWTRWNPKDSPSGHGDVGTGMAAGFDNWACGINKRSLDRVHAPRVVFRFQDEKGALDWTEDFHGSLLADDETWMTIGTYDQVDVPLPDSGVFENEIIQVALDGSGRFRRLLHTRTGVDNRSPAAGYWAMPKPTVSRDGRFIAYTSNWEKSGRYDLFIAKVEPPPGGDAGAEAPASPSASRPARGRPRRVN